MVRLALRPGFRPNARKPPNAPSGARDDEEPRQTEFELQGQYLVVASGYVASDTARARASACESRVGSEARTEFKETTVAGGPGPSDCRGVRELRHAPLSRMGGARVGYVRTGLVEAFAARWTGSLCERLERQVGRC